VPQVLAVVSPGPYLVACLIGAALIAAAVVGARRSARAARWACAIVGVVLIADVGAYLGAEVAAGTFSARSSLPLAACNAAVVVAALACFTWWAPLVALTYFVGLAGTIQGLATPDLSTPFPHLVFFEYVAGHLGVVAAAVILVAGARLVPARGVVWRTYLIVAGYTAFVGLVDALTGADYMFLRKPPANTTLLSALGPFPWYIASAAALAVVLFALLDLPLATARRRSAANAGGRPVRAEQALVGEKRSLH
jgi:hypothetical integral membrane protein (TIGR02206 family)